MDIVLTSTIICPVCGLSTTETMPEDTCQFMYQCPHCNSVFRPLAGDCCVFCSYGTVVCPSKQRESLNPGSDGQ